MPLITLFHICNCQKKVTIAKIVIGCSEYGSEYLIMRYKGIWTIVHMVDNLSRFWNQLIASEIKTQPYKRTEHNLLADTKVLHHLDCSCLNCTSILIHLLLWHIYGSEITLYRYMSCQYKSKHTNCCQSQTPFFYKKKR